uniref:Uncharacterized protein n=1 Tax=Strombidinopsis acuminata TaxID=141414 RepID=A0A7S3SCI8_9SPIT|mmetsp:Transcript_36342/g.93684  ORF Transcript_36342/g.93684 Transcript_36342/m.93684 type:complete len:157 (-) Transcript_36342:145-615(-)|eukprot:CAMPEP_0195066178 /NCGR_PEP_ID=MMETSP0448-20130528/11594_1 /TAXON_ID=66468 /ORGANISM="Heterocapsa triquestra, Strain CCMP 448" /LENGTH=156 /DNA_ID=CAMNT_0040097373 /DNA_START=97 /DNA_END=567 /DNA_ORIENTATION=-
MGASFSNLDGCCWRNGPQLEDLDKPLKKPVFPKVAGMPVGGFEDTRFAPRSARATYQAALEAVDAVESSKGADRAAAWSHCDATWEAATKMAQETPRLPAVTSAERGTQVVSSGSEGGVYAAAQKAVKALEEAKGSDRSAAWAACEAAWARASAGK